jgi:hypothetical protein
MSRWLDSQSLHQLIATAVPESGSLEFKREVTLAGSKQRRELLKDLTGMANGGGGTVIYGIEESADEPAIAAGFRPLENLAVVGQIEDIVRAGCRPRLLCDLRLIDVGVGSALVVDVAQSPLGPVMVDSYGDPAYFLRQGTRTAPMTESQVRAAYHLAERGAERRPQVWRDHQLPIALVAGADHSPWLSVAAVPYEPLRELLDVGTREAAELVPAPTEPERQVLRFNDMDGLISGMSRWADGFAHDDGYGPERPATSAIRIHRDGAAGLARSLYDSTIPELILARLVDAHLTYLGWLWSQVGLVGSVEVRISLGGIAGTDLVVVGQQFQSENDLRVPLGVTVGEVAHTEAILAWEAQRSVVRHRVARTFVDRVRQAYGLKNGVVLFEIGQLYDADGPLDLAIAGGGIWDSGAHQRGVVWDDGTITAPSLGLPVAHVLPGGVIVDVDGATLGVVELAAGDGCPDDFMPPAILADPRARVPGGAGSPNPRTDPITPPNPTGNWSQASFSELLQPTA